MKLTPSIKQKGHVYIVGAGTGDPDLLTVKALRIISTADVVIYDNLISADILAFIPEETEKVYVGKVFNSKCILQSEINQKILKHAELGKTVCRLKGGDPFVFGRGGEEALFLDYAGIAFDIVPGITAAVGCCSYAGIPVTHRGISNGVTIVTARNQHDSDHINWKGLANVNHTIVFYMGLHKAGNISKNLIDHGLRKETPTAIISNGTRHDQRVIRCSLSELPDAVDICNPPMPAVIVVGHVVKLSETIDWFTKRETFDGYVRRFFTKMPEAEHV
ncbi:Uroporphyrinogen-III C-methyltransferase [Vibrio coralliirubri]|uniref:uroporphyrinogen-III C-methyltransferase n=1 Tax=Vibrio coralliirubri TaxID=1516159 RepID=UPI0006376BCA|nr:uroporphyrinogen-III C-methyltransferase [Vibrio coralliirubri]CDT92235.1 Uroporphyrinogen-III C-methyltransferase [Vibrio coralliirubri]